MLEIRLEEPADVPFVHGVILRAFRNKLDARPDVYDRVQVVALQAPNAMAPVPNDSVGAR